MSIVFAAMVPHGAIAISPSGRDDEPAVALATQQAFLELGRRLEAARVDRVVVLTPHNVHVSGHFAVIEAAHLAGDLSFWDAPAIGLEGNTDQAYTGDLLEVLRQAPLPTVGVCFGAGDPDASVHPMDWATLIPLWYLGGRADPPVPAVVVTPSRDRPVADHLEVGRAIAEVADRRGGRTAIVASCDHGHGHQAEGPYGFRPESAVYDDRVMSMLREDRLGDVLDLDASFVRAAAADSWWQLLILHGALGSGWTPELLSYEHPTYYGMAVCGFTERGAGAAAAHT